MIDKVLARYSEEFTGSCRDASSLNVKTLADSSRRIGVITVFRELLQNSDDASAKAVEIHFDTEEYVQRTKDGVPAEDESEKSVTPLPDLKKVIVRLNLIVSSMCI